MPGGYPWGLCANFHLTTQTSLPDRGLIPEVRRRASPRAGLVLLATLLLAQSLPRKRFFSPALLAWLHIEAVLLYFLDDVFLLHFPLKAAECVLKRLTLLNDYFCQCNSPQFRLGLDDCSASIRPWALPLIHYRMRLLASCSQFTLSKSRTLSPKALPLFSLSIFRALFASKLTALPHFRDIPPPCHSCYT